MTTMVEGTGLGEVVRAMVVVVRAMVVDGRGLVVVERARCYERCNLRSQYQRRRMSTRIPPRHHRIHRRHYTCKCQSTPNCSRVAVVMAAVGAMRVLGAARA